MGTDGLKKKESAEMACGQGGDPKCLPYNLFGRFVTAELADGSGPRQGYIIDLNLPEFRIVGESGRGYICKGKPRIVTNHQPLIRRQASKLSGLQADVEFYRLGIQQLTAREDEIQLAIHTALMKAELYCVPNKKDLEEWVIDRVECEKFDMELARERIIAGLEKCMEEVNKAFAEARKNYMKGIEINAS